MRRALPLLLAALLVGGAAAGLLFLRSDRFAAVDLEGRSDPAADDPPLRWEDLPDATAGADDHLAPASVQRAIEEPDPVVTLADPGIIRVLVLDGADGRPAVGAKVRFLGERRYCERTVDEDGRCEARLTPDVYEIGAFLEHRERATAAPTAVASGTLVDVPALVLRPGTGRIEGQLAARGVQLDRPFRVELYGVGRHPCDACRARFAPVPSPEGPSDSVQSEQNQFIVQANGAKGAVLQLTPRMKGTGDTHYNRVNLTLQGLIPTPAQGGADNSEPGAAGDGNTVASTEPSEAPEARPTVIPETTCTRCGYDKPHSTQVLWPGGSFSFQALDGGRYRLLARREPKDSPAAEEIIALEPFEARRVDLDAREFCAVDFDLRDESGAPFDGTWWEEPEAEDASAQSVLRSTPIRYRFFATDRRVAVARAAPAMREGAQPLGTHLSFSLSQWRTGSAGDADRDDRERGKDDTLWPAFRDPDVSAVSLPLKALADHRHRIDRLPRRRLEVEVVCGPWRSGQLPLDLEFAMSGPVVVTLQRDQLPAESEEFDIEIDSGQFILDGNIGVILAPPAEDGN